MTAMVFPRAGRLVDIFGSSVLEGIVNKVTQVCGGVGYDAGNSQEIMRKQETWVD